ncbi:28323_t:CDS:2, partial [Gigaspora margarita]
MVGINTCRTDCTDVEWIEYCNMPQIHDNETPKNNLLPIESKKYLEARKLIQLLNSSSYAPEIRIAICFSCDYNKYCGVNYNKYLLKVKKKSISGYDYDNKEIGKKIQAVNVIQQKWLEYFYKPDSLCTTELAQHYQLLWVVRE